jgi:hypothetical protein
MTNEPRRPWRECKQIAEALSHRTTSGDARQQVRGSLLECLAATGERGAALAAKLANTDGPIPMEPGEMEVLELMKEAMTKRIAEKAGIAIADGHFSYDASLLK